MLKKQGATILDYGCGYGRTLCELRKAEFINLYDVDFSEEMIKRAKCKSQMNSVRCDAGAIRSYSANY